MTMSRAAIIVAAGNGRRFGNQDKVLVQLGGRPIIAWSLDLFTAIAGVSQIVVVAGEHSIDRIEELVSGYQTCPVSVCLGGETRRDSVRAGFSRLSSGVDLVAVHDAARPLADAGLVERVFQAAAEHGAAVPGLPATDTMYQVGPESVAATILPRETLRAVQTPQVARYALLDACLHLHGEYTDEGSALVAAGHPVAIVDGCQENIKITHPGDLERAEGIRLRRSL